MRHFLFISMFVGLFLLNAQQCFASNDFGATGVIAAPPPCDDQAPPLQIVSIITKPSCQIPSYGEATISISGGTAPYTFTFEGLVPITEIPETTYTMSGLTGGESYRIHVTDINGCSTDYSDFHIDRFPEPLLVAEQSKLVNCDTNTNGAIVAHAEAVSGGSNNFWYKCDDGQLQNTGYFTGLSAGYHKVVAVDGNNCQTEENVDVRFANDPVVTATGEKVCYNTTGSIYAEAYIDGTDGIVRMYQLFFKNGEKRTDPQTSNIFTSLTASVYTVKVTDSYGCVGEGDAEIAAPSSPLGLLLKDSQQPTDNVKGSITVTTTGGWEGYTIVCKETLHKKDIGTLTDMAPGDYLFGNLDAGRYQITITDKEGCSGAHLDVPLGNLTGEPELEASGLSIYPNPSGDGRFYIEWNNAENRKVTLEIYNMSGQLLDKAIVTTGLRTSLDISGRSSGVYLLRVPELNIIRKLVVQ